MTARLAQIWRYPIKAHGAEPLQSVTLSPGQTMPWDRAWAVVHERSRADGSHWANCGNFSRGANHPALMAITCQLDEGTQTLRFSHPNRPDISLNPDSQSDDFISWLQPLLHPREKAPARIVRAQSRGMTDTDFASISLNNPASNAEVGEKLGQELSPLRWRGNLWFDGLEPWQENEWLGKTLKIGAVRLEVIDPIGRCLATTANPKTGQRDVNTLAALKRHWGHTNFGVYAMVRQGGQITVGDELEVLP